MSLVERLLEWERRDPKRVWLVQPFDGVDRSYTFADAAREVRAIAAAIRSWDLPAGSRIALSGRNTAHWILCDLAISMAGHVAVGFYPRQGKPTTDFILRHAEISHVFLGPSLMAGDAEEFAAGLPSHVHTIAMPYSGVPRATQRWDEFISGAVVHEDYQTPAPNDLGWLVYTSGTSGDPKGVMLTHHAIDWTLQNLLDHGAPPKEHEVFFSYLPLAHLMERLFGEAMGLALGAEMHFLEKPEVLAVTLSKVAPTRFAGVPLVYSRIQAGILAKLPQAKLDRLLSIPLFGTWFKGRIRRKMGLHRVDTPGVGAAAMTKEQIDWFGKLGLEIYQGYGMTENCAYAAIEKPGERRAGSVGRQLPGSGFRLSDNGEIQFKHAGLMKGYFKDPERTRETFTDDGWLHTGDRGHLDADGYLYVTGRLKDEFKTGKGKYVSPAPIEAKLSTNTDLEQVCLIGAGLHQPIMLATLNEVGRKQDRAALVTRLERDIASINASIEEHARIAKCVIVDDVWSPMNGLVTPTGKMRRPVVESHYHELVTRAATDRSKVVQWATDVQPSAAAVHAAPL